MRVGGNIMLTLLRVRALKVAFHPLRRFLKIQLLVIYVETVLDEFPGIFACLRQPGEVFVEECRPVTRGQQLCVDYCIRVLQPENLTA